MRVCIETERLILKNLNPENYEEMFQWCGDPEVARYMIYPVYTNALDCKAYIESINPDDPNSYDLGIFWKETGEAIGSGGYTYHPDEDAWEVGYNLRRDMWGKGIVPEAMRAILAYIQNEREVKAITGTFATENSKSRRVMEKLGMSFYKETEFTKIDGSETFKATVYRKEL